ncbi:hypothetical protein AB0H57_16810 [Micromonospora sp. NPDC050686]|uniref:hypothetical protein n=1 Tax=Micromonospora sp. NPDC050686 TaxID=3154631 RepID=UPI00340E0E9D
MSFWFWRRRTPVASVHIPRPRSPHNEGPSWSAQPTEVFPTLGPGRAGNLTPAQRWRAGGWRRNGGLR